MSPDPGNGPRLIGAGAVAAALGYADLVAALDEMFRAGCEAPLRHHHTVAGEGGADGTLLLMPAWQQGGDIGIKIVTVFPDNAKRSLPSVIGSYLLLDGTTGEPRALIDGSELTVRRTACASALAARYLARADAARMVMVGAGALAPHLIRAHAAVRPLKAVRIWNHNPVRARDLAAGLQLDGIAVEAIEDLEAAVRGADIVSCATLSAVPLVQGAWLQPGSHLDLVGAFRPDMRESDDAAVRRARIFVDTRAGALSEGGDLAIPLSEGVITEADVQADLFELARGERPGRGADDEITLFKSVGTALEDLAAARLVAARA
ncbi:MAG TPA: ornithine cyclodeaminase family protein [Alphaproteobacteria bacterium]|nr:ornithine cyclodeaminase family protein [Alphaproteobacteria bacterium]